jgi:hypothetical protein
MKIEVGKTYLVKDNLWAELVKLGFDKLQMMHFSHSMVGTHRTVRLIDRLRPMGVLKEIPTKSNTGMYVVTTDGHLIPTVCLTNIPKEKKKEEIVEEVKEPEKIKED